LIGLFREPRVSAPRSSQGCPLRPQSAPLHRENAAVRVNVCFGERVNTAWSELDRKVSAICPGPDNDLSAGRVDRPIGTCNAAVADSLGPFADQGTPSADARHRSVDNMNARLAGLIWLIAAVLLTLSASALAYRSCRRYAKRASGAPGCALARTGPPTALDQLYDAPEAAHPGQNGLVGLFANADAFAARVLSAQQAGRSLDLMYYQWETDLTGWLLLRELQAAADRGVRVRLPRLEPIDARSKPGNRARCCTKVASGGRGTSRMRPSDTRSAICRRSETASSSCCKSATGCTRHLRNGATK
jgi:hypothetical protein